VDVKGTLLDLLAHPNIASKRWIVRQYDHEVQGGTVLKPLVGPGGIGPGDAAVIQPVPGSKKGLAIACGLAIPVGDPALGGDPYLMALAAVDECVRNLVCVGANPDRIAILDNFCWASCAKPENLGALVRAAEGCYDAAKAYKTPFISGKDSLNNQFRTGAGGAGEVIEIPPTLLITGVGIVEDVSKCVTMDAKDAGSRLVLVGSHDLMKSDWHLRSFGLRGRDDGSWYLQHETAGPRTARAVHKAIAQGDVLSAHDLSEGGLIVGVAEMLIAAKASGRSLGFRFARGPFTLGFGASAYFFELPGHYLLEVRAGEEPPGPLWRSSFGGLGRFDESGVISFVTSEVTISVEEAARAFLGTLEW
jgi:phosphoribosylformylglycinamidine synthase